MQLFQVFLPLKEPLMTTLSGTCALTSTANIAEKDVTISKYQKHLDYFGGTLTSLKLLNCDGFFL